MAVWVGQTVCSPCSAYQLRPRRVEHADDDAVDLEAPLRDLGDHQVGVVAVGGRDERVGLLDARLHQRVDLERGAHGERPPRSSQPSAWPRSSSAMASASSSRTDTS